MAGRGRRRVKLFVFGLGYSAQAVVRRLRPGLSAAWGTTRDPGKAAEIEGLGVTPILFGSEASGQLAASARDVIGDALRQADHVLVSIGPDAAGDPVLRHFREALAAARPSALVYLSTVGVYGDHGGAWVDEASACRPVSKRSRERLAAEQAWQAFAGETGVPVAILRLAGIYGPGRGPFEKIRRGTARRIVKPGQVFNRIHVEDIAAIVAAALARRADGIFNGADDEPAPPQDVLAHAAALLGAPPPPEIAFEAAELTPMARSFYGENKRVRNAGIKAELGVRLAYPTYREGLAAVLASESEAPPLSSSS
jgi:nucleoside-diphosphate-sugar epimerase